MRPKKEMFVLVSSAILGSILILVRSRWGVGPRLLALSAVLGLLFVAYLFLTGAGVLPQWISHGEGEFWYDVTPWKELLLFGALMLGMTLRVISDAVRDYQQRKAKARGEVVRGPVFEKWSFVQPAVVAVLVFQVILSFAKDQKMSWQLALYSLQNGFFWDAIFERVKKGKEA